jgi:hypothetical protein
VKHGNPRGILLTSSIPKLGVRLYVHLLSKNSHFVCLLHYVISNSNQIMVATAEGVVYFYALNTNDGSFCQFLTQHSLLDSSECLNRSISSEVFQKDDK